MYYLIKRNEGFIYSAYYCFLPEGVDAKDVIEVSEETIEKLKKHEIMWKNGKLIINPNYNPNKVGD